MKILRVPNVLQWDDRLLDKDRPLFDDVNAVLLRLDEMRATEINVSGPFARSKIAWKLASYQHALLHRIVALMDGVARAWNHRSTLSAMLSARAFMETLAIMHAFEADTARMLAAEDISGLDALVQRGTFASRDAEFVKNFPASKAVNILTFIDRFDRLAEGFRGHYDMLSERCHPNALGHNFMFARLDRSTGTVSYSEETEPRRNAHMIFSAILPLCLVEGVMKRLDKTIEEVAEIHHRLAPMKGFVRGSPT